MDHKHCFYVLDFRKIVRVDFVVEESKNPGISIRIVEGQFISSKDMILTNLKKSTKT